ncbi:hypothetical protein OEZ86_001099 [Tetradesmus obliquus]|nr:hypothetical protein OEZ86_001099 [Tetradesmus obliquus]
MFALNQRMCRPGMAAAAKPHSSTLLPLRATTRRPAALRVVAFREDDRQSQIKRGTRDAKNQARNVANQGKQQLQKGKNNINRRVQSADIERPVANNPNVYGINTAVLALAAGFAAASPLFTASILFKPEFLAAGGAGSALIEPLMRILSLGWSSAAVTNYVQGAGAIEDDLDSLLHKRLNAGLSTFCIAQALLLGILLTPLSENILAGALGTDVLNTSGLIGLTAGVGFQLWVASVNYAQNAPEGYNAVKDVRAWISEVANTFTGVNGFTSLLYAILTVGFFGAGISYLVAPVPMLQAVFGGSVASAGPESIVLWQLIGIGLSTIVAPACLSLKEGAAEEALSDVRYKLLNIGLLTAGVGHCLVLQPRLGDPSTSGGGLILSTILVAWGTAAVLGGKGLLKSNK